MTDEIPTGQLNKTVIDEFLARPLLARLATADPATGQPHIVPLWYGWDGTSIWISAFRSTRKIRELIFYVSTNPPAALAPRRSVHFPDRPRRAGRPRPHIRKAVIRWWSVNRY